MRIPKVGQRCEIVSLKFDGTVHRDWEAFVSEHHDDRIVLEGVFEQEIRHRDLGVIVRGTRSIETYWKTKFYSLFKFFQPDGIFRNLYVNINLPPSLHESRIEFVDLDLDVLVTEDGTVKVLDEAEFQSNSTVFKYPAEVIVKTREALDEVLELIEKRAEPFLVENLP
ncbi:MAG: DUF402 domain-containing protein [Pyrinomonadaceae bacterium]